MADEGPYAEEAVTESEVASFAADLRLLRLSAGNPTLVSLQHATGISRSVLSDAFVGRRLPSARTVDGVVRACGADPSEWLKRRDRLTEGHRTADERRLLVEDVRPTVEVETRAAPRAARRMISITRTTLLVCMAFVIGATAASGITVAIMRNQIESAPAAVVVHNGDEVEFTPCRSDARVLASERRAANAVLQIMWSDRCRAAWATTTIPTTAVEVDTTVRVSLYIDGLRNGPDTQDDTENNLEKAETPLLVRPDTETRLCAVGTVSQGATTIDLGAPVCI